MKEHAAQQRRELGGGGVMHFYGDLRLDLGTQHINLIACIISSRQTLDWGLIIETLFAKKVSNRDGSAGDSDIE